MSESALTVQWEEAAGGGGGCEVSTCCILSFL